jgi:hypothetical protein
MSAENIREHKNFDDAKADLVIHPVNVESAANVFNHIKIDK